MRRPARRSHLGWGAPVAFHPLTQLPLISRRLFLCSAATDGSLAFWDLTTLLDQGSPALEVAVDPGLPFRE